MNNRTRFSQMEMSFLGKLKAVWNNITVEPAYFLFWVCYGLINISSQQLYKEKICTVNFQHNDTVCGNIYQYPKIQITVQKKAAEIQAYNGILQSLPAILFALFAGPLSDRYGRKPTLIISLVGYLLLSCVFIVNSILFFELKAEYLLFECFQDVTGGEVVFLLGVYSLLVDKTTPQRRTRRMAVLSAVGTFGFMVGLHISLIDKNKLGWTHLYLVSLGVNVLNMLYVIFGIRESVDCTSTESAEHFINKTERWKSVLMLPISGFKNIIMKRPDGRRVWILILVIILNIHLFVQRGDSAVSYLYFTIHFEEDPRNLIYAVTVLCSAQVFAELIIIPILIENLKWRDTSIIILGTIITIIGYLFETLVFDLWGLYIGHMFHSFYGNIASTSKSCLSKLVEVTEIGSILSVIGVLQAILAIGSKPFFAKVYEATVDVYPGTYKFASISLLGLIVLLAGVAYFGLRGIGGMRAQNSNEQEQDNQDGVGHDNEGFEKTERVKFCF